MSNPLAPLAHQLRAGDVVLIMVIVLLSIWVMYQVLRLSRIVQRSPHPERCARFALNVGVLLGFEQAYEFSRGHIPYRTDIALTHAYRLLDIEWRHGFFVESRIERFFLQFQLVMNAIDVFYVLGHILVTIGVIAWIYLQRSEHYSFLRNMLVLTTAFALVAFYLYPTAPPRMLHNYGFFDPLQVYGLVADGGGQADSYTYNPYAAMPSLHVAYALIVGWVVILAEKKLWARSLAVVYPLAMSAAVVISGNHWLLDVMGAFIVVGLASVVLAVLKYTYSRVHHRLSRVTLGRQYFGMLAVE